MIIIISNDDELNIVASEPKSRATPHRSDNIHNPQVLPCRSFPHFYTQTLHSELRPAFTVDLDRHTPIAISFRDM